MVVRELDARWPAGRTPARRGVRHSLLPAGKLFRPCLLLAGAQAVGGDPMSVLPAAVAAEFGHVGSLIHDDIIDADAVRRGRPAAHRKYGVDEAIVAGDLLFFSLFECLAECRDRGVPADRVVTAVAAIARAGMDLCRGQSLEARLTGGRVFEVGPYLEMVRLKTAALFRAACEVGGILGGGGPPRSPRWSRTRTIWASPSRSMTICWPTPATRTAWARRRRATSGTGGRCFRSSSPIAMPAGPPGARSRTASRVARIRPRRWPR